MLEVYRMRAVTVVMAGLTPGRLTKLRSVC